MNGHGLDLDLVISALRAVDTYIPPMLTRGPVDQRGIRKYISRVQPCIELRDNAGLLISLREPLTVPLLQFLELRVHAGVISDRRKDLLHLSSLRLSL